MDGYPLITGTGLATAQGANVDATWQRLVAGAVLHETGRVPLKSDGSPRVSQLAIHVANEALAAGGWSPQMLASPRTALIVGTSKGPIEEWLAVDPATVSSLAAPRRCDSIQSMAYGISALTTDLAAALRMGTGPRLTLASACASGLHALLRAKDLLEAGLADRVLVVAAESSISELFQGTFHRLGVLADAATGCRPFDQNRHGFLLAEAAAAVCLERSAQASGIWLGPGAVFADATHLTGLDADAGAVMNALLAAEIGQAQLIHAHGTGTIQNDTVEALAISQTAAPARPLIYSHKHAVGHTQGAAGLVAAVLNVEMHRRQSVLPNANTQQPIPIIAAQIPATPQPHAIHHSVIHAAGFGGAIAAISMKSAS